MEDVIIKYYSNFNEKDRLISINSLERIRSQEIILRYLPKKKIKILDIGGAAVIYSFWLASLGYEVDLIDLTPTHIDQAKVNEKKSGIKLNSIQVGNACELPYKDNIYDFVLLMGPMYHLLKKEERIKALSESKRVLKSGGTIIVAVISKYASMVDGFKHNLISDQKFVTIMLNDITNGIHLNITEEKNYFTDSYFHHPNEIKEEMNESGIVCKKIIAVEGFGSFIEDEQTKMGDNKYKELLLECIRRTEEESSILGISCHILGIGEKR